MKSLPKFKPQIKVTFVQLVIIIITLLIIFSIPFVITYIRNPDKKSISEVIDTTFETFKISKVTAEDTPFEVTIPLINQKINLTIIKKNPHVIIYFGLVLAIFSFLIGASLAKSLFRKREKKKFEDKFV